MKIISYPPLVIGAALLIVIFIHTLSAEAEFALLDPLVAEKTIEKKTDTQSDTIQSLYEYNWSSFAGSVPEGATITGIALTLSWAREPSEEKSMQEAGEGPDVKEVTDSAATAGDGPEPTIAPPTETSSTTTAEPNPDISDDIHETPIVQEPETEQHAEVQTTTDSVPSENFEETTEQTTEQAIEGGVDESVNEDVPEVEAPEQVVGIIKNTPVKTYQLASEIIEVENDAPVAVTDVATAESEAADSHTTQTVVEPDAQTSPMQEEAPIEVEIPEASTTLDSENPTGSEEKTTIRDDELSTETSMSEPASLYPTLEAAEIQYSLDSISWTTLGSTNLLTNNSVAFSLSTLPPEAIPSLRVRVVYLAPARATDIVFQNPQIKLSFIPLPPEIPVPGPSDQEPNFLVSSVKSDVTSGYVRAVFLERGGVFEVWVGVLDPDSETTAWRRLTAGNSTESGTSISVNSGTVFWFDNSTRTLFAYDTRKESLTATPAPTVGDADVFTLVFGGGSRQRAVFFNAVTNTFDFTREPSSSQ